MDDQTILVILVIGIVGWLIVRKLLFSKSASFDISNTKRPVKSSKPTLPVKNDKLVVTRNAVPSDEWCRTSKVGFQQPESTVEEIPIPHAEEPHAMLVTNLVNAILDGEELIAPGESGIGSVELANVMVYSGLINETIDLPMDGTAWEAKLNDLIAKSTHEKKTVEVSKEDFTASFRR